LITQKSEIAEEVKRLVALPEMDVLARIEATAELKFGLALLNLHWFL
jgi:hypothetical protein